MVCTLGTVIFPTLLVYCLIVRALIAVLGPGMFPAVQCVYELRWPQINLYSNWVRKVNNLWQSSWLIGLVIVFLGYLIRIQDFYAHKRHPLYPLNWLVWKVMHSRTYGLMNSAVYEQ